MRQRFGFPVKDDLQHIFGQQIFHCIRAGGLAWLRYRLDMAGVKGSNPFRPIFFLSSDLLSLEFSNEPLLVCGGITKTRIMYRAFLSYTQMKENLTALTEKDLLRYKEDTRTFKTTEKGLRFLYTYNLIGDMIKEEQQEWIQSGRA